jgi:dolichol-phosphate mannosyltransferase
MNPTPQLVEQMLEQVEQGADVAIASRYHRGSQVTYPWRRFLVSKVYNLLVSFLFALGTTDSRSGLKLFRREKLIEALRFSPPQRVAFDVELLATIRRLGGTVTEIPVSAVYAQSPYTWTWADILHGLADTLRLFYNVRVRRLFSRGR